jgi:hypothetical protein
MIIVVQLTLKRGQTDDDSGLQQNVVPINYGIKQQLFLVNTANVCLKLYFTSWEQSSSYNGSEHRMTIDLLLVISKL